MAKKPQKDSATPTEASALKHNPFGALASKRDELPEQPPEIAPESRQAVEPKPKSRGRLVLRRETKHRGGKPVVIVRGFSALPQLDPAAVERLAKELKQKLGCGGTVERDGAEPQIVLQGDQPAKVADYLRSLGFRVDGVTS